MRVGVSGVIRVAAGAAVGWFGWLGCALASAQVFPVQTHFVPLVVAAVFILPAMTACVVSGLRRLRRQSGVMLMLGLMAATAVAMLAYADPHLLAVLRG